MDSHESSTRPRVAFIYAPFAGVTLPALGISLLKSALHKHGIHAEIYYVHLLLADKLGFPLYNAIVSEIPTQALLGEWLFAPCLQGPNPQADERYIHEILWGAYRDLFSPTIVHQLLQIREMLPRFLESWVSSVDWSSYTWVCFSSCYQQHGASLALAREIKENYPEIRILFGGSQCYGEMGAVLPEIYPFVDYVCVGEGDIAVPSLILADLDSDLIPEIPGIVSRSLEDKNQDYTIPIVHDLNALPYPDYTDYFSQLENISFPPGFVTEIPMEMSRGCWWGEIQPCRFCGIDTPSMAYRSKSYSRIRDELHHLSCKYGKRISFSDCVIPHELFKNSNPVLSSVPGVSLFGEVRPNLSRDQVLFLSKSGFTRIQAGIESFSDTVLRLMGKGTTVIQNIQLLKWGRQFGIYILYNLLWGFPGEEPEEYRAMEDLIPLLVHLYPPVKSGGHIRFDRYNTYMKYPEKFGISDIRPIAAYRHVFHALSESQLRSLAYYGTGDYPDNSAEYTRTFSRLLVEWHNNQGAILDLYRHDDIVTIIDTRRDPETNQYTIAGLEAEVYLRCDTAQTIAQLTEYFICEEMAISPILTRFIDQGLMIYRGSQYLSLAVIRS